jgi:hypothetical protein
VVALRQPFRWLRALCPTGARTAHSHAWCVFVFVTRPHPLSGRLRGVYRLCEEVVEMKLCVPTATRVVATQRQNGLQFDLSKGRKSNELITTQSTLSRLHHLTHAPPIRNPQSRARRTSRRRVSRVRSARSRRSARSTCEAGRRRAPASPSHGL